MYYIVLNVLIVKHITMAVSLELFSEIFYTGDQISFHWQKKKQLRLLKLVSEVMLW